jgi:hypothetical protein
MQRENSYLRCLDRTIIICRPMETIRQRSRAVIPLSSSRTSVGFGCDLCLGGKKGERRRRDLRTDVRNLQHLLQEGPSHRESDCTLLAPGQLRVQQGWYHKHLGIEYPTQNVGVDGKWRHGLYSKSTIIQRSDDARCLCGIEVQTLCLY